MVDTEVFLSLLNQEITEVYNRVEEIIRSRGWRDVVLGEEITTELEAAKDALLRARLLGANILDPASPEGSR